MKRYLPLIAAGLLIGASLGAATSARALECLGFGTLVHLEPTSVTVGGEERELVSAPMDMQFIQVAYDPEHERFTGSHQVSITDPRGNSMFYVRSGP